MTLKFTNPEDLKQKTYYLAGKMSGLMQFNVPEFYRVAAKLREMGHKILNPAEQDSPAVRDAALRSMTGSKRDLPQGETWGHIMGRDVEIVIENVDGVIVFPNWTESPGARIEVAVAGILGKPVLVLSEDRKYGELTITPLAPSEIKDGVFN